MKPLRNQFFYNSTTLTLLGSNLLTIIVAVWEKWPLINIMWIYWGQSVIIGLFNFARILDLDKFSTKNLYSGGEPVPETRRAKYGIAFFFLFHYGFFHLGYCVFLVSMSGAMASASGIGIFVCVLAFLVNHLFSFLHNRQRDKTRTPNLGTIMFFPYARIIPMHLTIIFGAASGIHSRFSLVLFLLLKTLSDMIMHMVEHADARKREMPLAEGMKD